MSEVVSARVVRRLRWHAGLEDIGETAVPSVSVTTSPAAGLSERVGDAIADLVGVLTELNRELNGGVPLEGGEHATVVPRAVAYAIAEVSRMLRDSEVGSREAWLVDAAWSAILAGDIDDLQGHLADEEAARANGTSSG